MSPGPASYAAAGGYLLVVSATGTFRIWRRNGRRPVVRWCKLSKRNIRTAVAVTEGMDWTPQVIQP